MSAPTCGDRWGRGEIGAALSGAVRAYADFYVTFVSDIH